MTMSTTLQHSTLRALRPDILARAFHRSTTSPFSTITSRRWAGPGDMLEIYSTTTIESTQKDRNITVAPSLRGWRMRLVFGKPALGVQPQVRKSIASSLYTFPATAKLRRPVATLCSSQWTRPVSTEQIGAASRRSVSYIPTHRRSIAMNDAPTHRPLPVSASASVACCFPGLNDREQIELNDERATLRQVLTGLIAVVASLCCVYHALHFHMDLTARLQEESFRTDVQQSVKDIRSAVERLFSYGSRVSLMKCRWIRKAVRGKNAGKRGEAKEKALKDRRSDGGGSGSDEGSGLP